MLDEEVDYTTLVIPKIDRQGGLNKLDYALTLNSAKEIAMLKGGEKGKEARTFFYSIRKIAKELNKVMSPEEQLLTNAQLLHGCWLRHAIYYELRIEISK